NWRRAATLASRTARPGVSWRGSVPPPLLSPTDGATRFAGWPKPRQDLIAGACPPGRALPRTAQEVAAQSLGGGGHHRQGGGRAAPHRRRAGQQADCSAAAAVATDGGKARREPAAQDRCPLPDRPGGGRVTGRSPRLSAGVSSPGYYVGPAGIYVLFPM